MAIALKPVETCITAVICFYMSKRHRREEKMLVYDLGGIRLEKKKKMFICVCITHT